MEHDAHEGEPFIEGFLHLLGDPSHWAFEFTTDVAFSVIAYPFIRMVVKVLVARHDAKAHPRTKAHNSNTTAEEANA